MSEAGLVAASRCHRREAALLGVRIETCQARTRFSLISGILDMWHVVKGRKISEADWHDCERQRDPLASSDALPRLRDNPVACAICLCACVADSADACDRPERG